MSITNNLSLSADVSEIITAINELKDAITRMDTALVSFQGGGKAGIIRRGLVKWRL